MNWNEFLIRANEVLRRPHDRSGFGFHNLLQIVIRHYACPPESWDILCPDDNKASSTVILRTWQQEVDYPDTDRLEEEGYGVGTERFQEAFNRKLPLHPTISEKAFQVDSRPIVAQIAKIRSISVPLAFQGDPPTGSVFYEAIFGNVLNGVAFRWWDSGPTEWHEAIQAINTILVYLQGSQTTE